MKLVEIIQDQTVYGITVRTKNSDEMSPEKARIGKLWESFYGELVPKLKDSFTTYGVYSHYESDHSEEFNVTACTDQEFEATEPLILKAGKYLVFSAQGKMPAVVIETWGNIWSYFSNENCTEKRAYQTDYELYKSPTEIEIYIGVK